MTDQAQQTWNSRDMYQSLGLVALFTMVFVTCLCFLKVHHAALPGARAEQNQPPAAQATASTASH